MTLPNEQEVAHFSRIVDETALSEESLDSINEQFKRSAASAMKITDAKIMLVGNFNEASFRALQLTQALSKLSIANVKHFNENIPTLMTHIRGNITPSTIGKNKDRFAKDEAKRARKAQIQRNGGKR